MTGIGSIHNFKDAYEALLSTLEKTEFDSKESGEIENTVRIVLKINELARTDLEKMQLSHLAGRVEKLTSNAPESEKIRNVLQLWKNDFSEGSLLEVKIDSAFQDVASLPQKFFILQWLQTIPVDRRTDMITKLRSLFDGNDRKRAEIFRVLEEIPVGQRVDVFEKAMPTLEGIARISEKLDVISAIHKFSERSRADVVEKALPLLKEVKSGYQRTIILRAVWAIPESQRADVVEKAISILEGITDGHSMSTAFSNIGKIREEFRPYAVKKTLAIAGEMTLYRTSVLEQIGTLVSEEGIHVAEKALLIVEGVRNVDARMSLLQGFAKIAAGKRADIIEKAGSVFKGLTNVFSGKRLLKAVEKIPEEQREDVVEKALSLFEGISDEYAREFILLTIKEIPREHRTPIVIRSIPDLFVFGDGFIFRAVTTIAPEQRADVIVNALPALAGVTDEYAKAHILKILGELPQEQRTPVVIQSIATSINFLYKDVSYVLGKTEVSAAIEEISSERKVDILKKAGLLVDGITDGCRIARILRALRTVPAEQLNETVDFVNGCKSLEKEVVLEALLQIPPGIPSRIWKNVLVQLDKIHAPFLQRQVFIVLHKALTDPAILKLFESQRTNELFSTSHSQVYRLLAACLWKNFDEDASLTTAAAVLNSKQSKDVSCKKIILNALLILSLTRVYKLSSVSL